MDRLEVTETFAGISLPGHLHTKESLHFATTFPFRDTDVVIVTYPKSGESRRRGRGRGRGQREGLGDREEDLRGTAERLGAFLGRPPGPETLGSLERHCSFAAMRDNAMANYSLIPCEIMDHSQGRFMRKGVVGDWREHFSPLQSARFDRVYQEEMGDAGLRAPWPMA
nr:sulfotransferase family cytosolic 2B member 1-like [Dromaius novaehollandiae]